MESRIQADLDWYSAKSRERGVTVRCPLATVYRCPRYYQSVSLLGEHGNTSIEAQADQELKNRWMKSDLWPVVDEQATSVISVDGTPTIYSRLCPEASYESFGRFAEYLSRSGDEIDRELRHADLASEGVPSSDFRWNWTSLVPMHYTECPLYAPLLHTSVVEAKPFEKKGLIAKLKESRSVKVLGLIGVTLGGAAKWAESLRKIWDSIFPR